MAAKAGDGLAPLGEQLKNLILLSTPVVVDCSHRSPPWGWLETEGGETVITCVFSQEREESAMDEIIIISALLFLFLGSDLLVRGISLKKKSLILGGILLWVYVFVADVLQACDIFKAVRMYVGSR